MATQIERPRPIAEAEVEGSQVDALWLTAAVITMVLLVIYVAALSVAMDFVDPDLAAAPMEKGAHSAEQDLAAQCQLKRQLP